MTGIGSLPLTCAKSAVRSVAELSPEVPFWPQLPQLSERERAVGQGLDLLANLLEHRSEGYGYQIRSGRIDAAVDLLHRSTGELTPSNAAGFGAFEEAMELGRFGSAAAVKGQIEGPITLAAYLFYKGRPFLSDSALFAAIAFHVSQMICWQVDRLKRSGLPVPAVSRRAGIVPGGTWGGRFRGAEAKCTSRYAGWSKESRSSGRAALLCRASLWKNV